MKDPCAGPKGPAYKRTAPLNAICLHENNYREIDLMFYSSVTADRGVEVLRMTGFSLSSRPEEHSDEAEGSMERVRYRLTVIRVRDHDNLNNSTV